MTRSILTVTVPAATFALTDLASVQAEMDLTGTTTDAAYLQTQIGAASAAIASWCGRVFARETVREIWRPDRAAEYLMLARFPVASITSVIVDGTTLDTDEYEMDAETGFLWRLYDDARVWWCGSKITVTYVGGYLLPGQAGRTLPHDVQRACVLLTAAQYNARGRDPLVRSEGAQDVGQVSYLDPRAGMEAMPPQVAALLSAYRSWRA